MTVSLFGLTETVCHTECLLTSSKTSSVLPNKRCTSTHGSGAISIYKVLNDTQTVIHFSTRPSVSKDCNRLMLFSVYSLPSFYK